MDDELLLLEAAMARGRRGRSTASCFPGDAPMKIFLSFFFFSSRREKVRGKEKKNFLDLDLFSRSLFLDLLSLLRFSLFSFFSNSIDLVLYYCIFYI